MSDNLLDLMNLDRALTPAERKALGKRPKKRGYAAQPGTGPAGETCGSCHFLFRNRLAKTYLKCELMRRFWTGGEGTDVRARSPACRNWMPATPSPPTKRPTSPSDAEPR